MKPILDHTLRLYLSFAEGGFNHQNTKKLKMSFLSFAEFSYLTAKRINRPLLTVSGPFPNT
jgi:hypothetical protein